jgi:hypothetical protein
VEVREIERRVETGEREMGSERRREGLRDSEGARQIDKVCVHFPRIIHTSGGSGVQKR